MLGAFTVCRYARVQMDDSPLYVFDQDFADDSFGRKMQGDFAVPKLFPEDLFKCMDSERPPFR